MFSMKFFRQLNFFYFNSLNQFRQTVIRYHGRIGMKGMRGYCREMTKRKFCDLINRKRNLDGYTRLNLKYINARHLECRKSECKMEKPVRKLLIHLIDQWFPLGIPQLIHLDRSIDLLQCIRQKIIGDEVPHLKYSNKFYALIPHQGDNRRRRRFDTVEYCDSKIGFVNKMKSAIECLDKAEERHNKNINPLDYFIENWLEIELKALDTNEKAYKILQQAVTNTQH